MQVLEEVIKSTPQSQGFVQSLLHTYGGQSDYLLPSLQLLANTDLSEEALASCLTSIGVRSSERNKNKGIQDLLYELEKRKSLPILTASAKLRKQLDLPSSSFFTEEIDIALTAIQDVNISLETRGEHLSLLETVSFNKKKEVLFSLLDHDQALELQQGVLEQLSNVNHIEVGQYLVDHWNQLSPASRRQASDILLFKEIHHDALLTGLEKKEINIGEMNFDLERRRTLLWWTDNENTKERASALFSDAGVVNRKEAIHQMKEALLLNGDIADGSEVFDVLCGQCHLYKQQGNDVGPILTEINRKSKESLLHEILDPNAAVDSKYVNHKIELNNGDIHIGIIDRETNQSIQLIKLGGISIELNKADISSFSSLGSSMMPEGLEANMSHQEMADLLAFLQQENSL